MLKEAIPSPSSGGDAGGEVLSDDVLPSQPSWAQASDDFMYQLAAEEGWSLTRASRTCRARLPAVDTARLERALNERIASSPPSPPPSPASYLTQSQMNGQHNGDHYHVLRPDQIPAGWIVRLSGLASKPLLNGRLAVTLGISQGTRSAVRFKLTESENYDVLVHPSKILHCVGTSTSSRVTCGGVCRVWRNEMVSFGPMTVWDTAAWERQWVSELYQSALYAAELEAGSTSHHPSDDTRSAVLALNNMRLQAWWRFEFTLPLDVASMWWLQKHHAEPDDNVPWGDFSNASAGGEVLASPETLLELREPIGREAAGLSARPNEPPPDSPMSP